MIPTNRTAPIQPEDEVVYDPTAYRPQLFASVPIPVPRVEVQIMRPGTAIDDRVTEASSPVFEEDSFTTPPRQVRGTPTHPPGLVRTRRYVDLSPASPEADR
jgi:hypothetical protein